MAGRVVPLSTSEQTVAAAAAAFLAQPSLARSTRRSFSQTLTRLVRELGGQRPLSTLTVEAVTVAVTPSGVGGRRRPGTAMWLPSAPCWGFCQRRRWQAEDLTVDLERRQEPADRTKGEKYLSEHFQVEDGPGTVVTGRMEAE